MTRLNRITGILLLIIIKMYLHTNTREYSVHSSLFIVDCTQVQLYNFIHRFLRDIESYFTVKIILSVSC